MKQKNLSPSSSLYNLQLSHDQSSLCCARIVVPKKLINHLYKETAQSIQNHIQIQGFPQGNAPLEYIESEYKINITEHLKEFLFKFGVINYLFKEITDQKLLVAGEPRLKNIFLEPNEDAYFDFELSIFPPIEINEWRYFPFKAPKRKNYKDLDKQANSFIQEEQKFLQEQKDENGLSIGDWVNFDITLIDRNNKPIDKNFTSNFWLKLGDEEIETPLQVLFKDKKKGEEFISSNQGLQDYFSDQLRTNYYFKISLLDVIPYNYFCFDKFKQHFKIKTNKDMHKKLVEVFSYRHDISQRRSMVEEALKLMLLKHPFSAPRHLVLRQQKKILHAIAKNPDYNVYRKQNDFQFRIQQLAEKQVKETLLIDQLAYRENITVTNDDIAYYLNFEKRPRTKEFIYFHLPETKLNGQEMPLPTQELSRTVIREKTINHVIYHLTKK